MTWSLIKEGWTKTGNLILDPRFADAAAGDFHIQSTTGRYHTATGNWLIDTPHSPALEAGDPASALPVSHYPTAVTSIWFNSGDTESNAPVGIWKVEFKAMPGWAKPENLTVTIAGGQTTVETTESRPASTALPGVLLLE